MTGESVINAINRGRITISINGSPVILLDGDSKRLDLEVSGIVKANMRLSDFFEARMKRRSMLLKSTSLARRLIKKGWMLSLYDRGDQILTAGRFSRLGPYIRFNPKRLSRIRGII
ncbi:MAG: hypothetical protein KGI33_01905 [Thaumarchaeota archaeon]|nr:hypothetical protein [Nitrososphaerota archaeon]